MFEDSFGHCRLRRLRRGAGQRRLRFAKSGVGFRAELLPQRPGEGLGARASVPKLDRRRCSPSERAHVVDSPAVPAGQSPYPRDCYIRASFFVVRFEKLVSLSNCINAGGEMMIRYVSLRMGCLLGKSKGLFDQISRSRESIGLSDRLLEPAGIGAIRRVV